VVHTVYVSGGKIGYLGGERGDVRGFGIIVPGDNFDEISVGSDGLSPSDGPDVGSSIVGTLRPEPVLAPLR